MSYLNPRTRNKLANTIKKQIPGSWDVLAPKGHSYVEIDQDGERPAHRFPMVGSTVLRVEEGTEGVTVTQYKRIRCVPGYSETRQKIGILASSASEDWQQVITTAITGKVEELGELEDHSRPKR